MEQRANSKHGRWLDDALERETEDLIRSGRPSRTEEWREPEPVEGEHLHLAVPPDHQPGAPYGMTAADAERRSDIARYLPPSAFPADRDMLLAYLGREAAPDDISDAIGSLPAGHQFRTIGEVCGHWGYQLKYRHTRSVPRTLDGGLSPVLAQRRTRAGSTALPDSAMRSCGLSGWRWKPPPAR